MEGRDLDAPAPEDAATCKEPGCSVRPRSGERCYSHSKRKKPLETRTPCRFGGCHNFEWTTEPPYCYWHTLQIRRGETLKPVSPQGRGFDRCSEKLCRNDAFRDGLCRKHADLNEAGLEDLGPGLVECPIRECDKLKRASKVLCPHHNQTATKYGLSPYQYLQRINKGCDICGEYFRMSIDHDHTCCPRAGSCGKCVRGALCGNCNNMLGHGKTPEILIAGARYLEDSNRP